MKNTMKNIAYAGIITASALLNGCMSDSGARFTLLDVSVGHQQTTGIDEESQTPVGEALFKKDCQPYDDSTISNGAIKNSALWRNYQNRDK